MSQAQAAADRLPWLADEPTPPKKRGNRREAAGSAVVAILAVAGLSYWMGAHTSRQPSSPNATARATATVAMPQARPVEPPQPQVVFEPAPEVRPVVEREVPIARPRAEKRSVERRPPTRRLVVSPPAQERVVAAAPTPAPATARPVPNAAPLTLWPATQSTGSRGRIVRIGAFGSRLQAKLGWRYMVGAYPAVAHLPATVVETRNSRGRSFYRFQIGTTSQAHSEVLCQRMEKIRLSCAVVGLPWKPKGVER